MSELRLDGWSRFNIWERSSVVRDLYRRRARDEAEEMDCAAQAVELLRGLTRTGESLLDVGCGSGYFFHSLRKREIALDYYGLDATSCLLEIGREELPVFGLDRDRLVLGRIEDMDGAFDHVLCMNVLSNLDNYHRPLERMLKMARKSLILRESIKDGAEYRYVVDEYLDSVRLRVHVNAYDRGGLLRFIADFGFAAREVRDLRTNGQPENTIGYPHFWSFVVAERN